MAAPAPRLDGTIAARSTKAARREPKKLYLSPRCVDLRTRVWLEFLGLPPYLWSERGVNAAIVEFGVVSHFDAASFRRAGRMVVEATVTTWTRVPRGYMANEPPLHAGAGPGPRHPVSLVILSYEPVDEEEGGGKRKKKVSAPAPLSGWQQLVRRRLLLQSPVRPGRPRPFSVAIDVLVR